MNIWETTKKLIQSCEGVKLTPYRCPAGMWTIGYGHKIREAQLEITLEDAGEFLEEDMRVAQQAVRRLIRIPLQAWEEGALISFTFNVGAGALQRSTLRQKLNRGEKGEIVYELQRWVFVGGNKSPGLVKRRVLEGKLFLGSQY